MASSTLLTVTKDDKFGRVLDRSSSLEKCHRIMAYILRWKSIETLKKEPLSATEVETSRTRWIQWVQQSMREDLEKSVYTACPSER